MESFESMTENVHEAGENDAGEGWQDLEEYQREQSIEIGDISPRETGIGQEGDKALPDLNIVAGKPLDKEARKRDKKERLKRERVAKEKAKHSK